MDFRSICTFDWVQFLLVRLDSNSTCTLAMGSISDGRLDFRSIYFCIDYGFSFWWLHWIFVPFAHWQWVLFLWLHWILSHMYIGIGFSVMCGFHSMLYCWWVQFPMIKTDFYSYVTLIMGSVNFNVNGFTFRWENGPHVTLEWV